MPSFTDNDDVAVRLAQNSGIDTVIACGDDENIILEALAAIEAEKFNGRFTFIPRL